MNKEIQRLNIAYAFINKDYMPNASEVYIYAAMSDYDFTRDDVDYIINLIESELNEGR